MLTTKHFADLCNTTKRTIIYYDRIGLLHPIAKKNTFRLYEPKQVLTFQKIQLLKSFGLTLSKVKYYLRKTSGLQEVFYLQKKDLKQKQETINKRISKLDEFLGNLKKGKPMVVPSIKTVQPYSYYGMEKEGRYVDIHKHQQEIFRLIGDTKYKNVGLTVFHVPYYSPDRSTMTTGVLIRESGQKEVVGITLHTVPKHKAVSYIHAGPYTYMSYVWQFLDRFIEENKLKRHKTLDTREFYIIGGLSGKIGDNYITELQIPIIQ